MRQGIKEFSSWPTIPQLYVKGEFVGGCDIIREMFETGELQQVLERKGRPRPRVGGSCGAPAASRRGADGRFGRNSSAR